MVNTIYGPGPVNEFFSVSVGKDTLGARFGKYKFEPGLVNTNWGPGLVNTDWGPRQGAKQKTGRKYKHPIFIRRLNPKRLISDKIRSLAIVFK